MSKLFQSVWVIVGLLAVQQAAAGWGYAISGTYVLEKDQFPQSLKKYNPSKIYVLYSGKSFPGSAFEGVFLRKDTITNLKKFSDSLRTGIRGYRLIFETGDHIDSTWQVTEKFRLTDKAFNAGDGLLNILAYDSSLKVVDQFIFNYAKKLNENTRGRSSGIEKRDLAWLLRQFRVYDTYDRNNYSVSSVWILSVGIDDYGPIKYFACKSDAQSYSDFFKKQFIGQKSESVFAPLFHEYVLLDKDATREKILGTLKEIARKSAFNDYFIFNFSGCSNEIKNDPVNSGTNFFPYDVEVTDQGSSEAGLRNRDRKDTTDPYKKCIPLRILQEHIQSIPANNQLFISEAGPSEKFKTEFIKTLMQGSPEIATILNKNRVIIVPNGFGKDDVICKKSIIRKGPINYYITSLESSNIYDLFKDEYIANQIAFKLKSKAWECQSFPYEYFDIFFEKKFLKEYNEIFQDQQGGTRGLKPQPLELKKTANLDGKQYALVVGTNNYKGEGWKKLPNAIADARAVRDELAQGYGFEVQILEDKPMDSVYKAIIGYYPILQPNDQLIIYFAGHGDMETDLMDDGFIVCTDSKSREDDPARNTYIQYVKLQKMINKIPARQILVMLDVCHGGTFNQKRSDPVKTISNMNVREFLIKQSKFTCRKFLSSVGSEEAFDGKPGDHSPFANLLLQVLRAKGRETNGIVTLSNIFSVLQTASMNVTATLKISPQKDGFGNDNPESEFFLIAVDKTVTKE